MEDLSTCTKEPRCNHLIEVEYKFSSMEGGPYINRYCRLGVRVDGRRIIKCSHKDTSRG